MNKLLVAVVLSTLSLHAQYNTEQAVNLGKKIVSQTIMDIAHTGDFNIGYEDRTADEKLYQELLDSVSSEEITRIMQEWQKYKLTPYTMELVKEFLRNIKDLCVQLDAAKDNYDLLKLYNELLPFVAQNRMAALITFHTFMADDICYIEQKASIIIYDALMHDADGSLITAALVGGRYPGSGSHDLAKFAQTCS